MTHLPTRAPRRPWPLAWGLAAALAAAGSMLQPTSALAQTTAAKTPITRADQLPRRSHTLPRLPSELLEGPLSELLPLADTLERDIVADLVRFDIQDQATLRSMVATRLNIALLRGDWPAVAPLAVQLRALQDKPGPKLTTGVLSELVAQMKREGKGADALQAWVGQRFSAMPWAEAQDSLKAMKGQTRDHPPVAGDRRRAQPGRRGGAQRQPCGRRQHVGRPDRRTRAARPPAAAARRDRRRPRARDRAADGRRAGQARPLERTLVALPASAPAKPVVVGIWDSGVDMALFRAECAARLGLRSRRQTGTRAAAPAGRGAGALADAQAAGQGQPRPARRTRHRRGAPTQADHGAAQTRAGEGVQGGPGAGQPCTRMARTWPASRWRATRLRRCTRWRCTGATRAHHRKPSEAAARSHAANYRRIVDAFKSAGARVVNMSWRYGPWLLRDRRWPSTASARTARTARRLRRPCSTIETRRAEGGIPVSAGDPVRCRRRQRGQQRRLRRVHPGGVRARPI